jgi:hypothetical protein
MNLILCALGAFAAFSAQALPTDTWPMYQGNPQHSGYVARTLQLDRAAPLWSTHTQYGGPNGIYPSAISGTLISDSMVITTPGTYFARTAPMVSQDIRTGQVLWSIDFGSVFSVSPPAVDEGIVYVLAESCLHAFQLDGTFLWRSPYEDQFSRTLGPTVVDGSVYFNGGYYGGLYSLSVQKGVVQWFAALPQMDGWAPTWDDGKVLTFTNQLDEFGSSNGAVESNVMLTYAWQPTRDNQAPVVVRGFAYVGYGRLYAFDIANQQLAWTSPLPVYSQISTDNRSLYAVVDGGLDVIDPTDGSVQWTWTPAAGATLSSNILVTASHVLVGGTDATYAINLQTHALDHTFAAGGALSYGADTLVISGTQGTLSAFTLPSTDSLFANGFE